MTRSALCVALAFAGVTACGDSGSGDGVLPGVQAMLFVKRAFVNEDGTQDLGGNGNVFDYLRYHPGGGVYVLEPPTPDGDLRNITGNFEDVDIAGIDLSFDARQVVFSMRHRDDDRYHVWLGNVDGSNLRQLTFGPSHDVKPIFLAGDRVAFVTNEPYTAMGTRADEYNHARIVSQIATISVDGGDASRRVCAQNLSHTVDLFSMADGRVGYSRWEHLGPVNDLKMFAMNPDCTNMLAVAGQFNKPFNSLVQASEVEPGVFVAIGTSREDTFQAGALIRVDARSQTSDDPNRLDVQQARIENITPAVPTGEESPPSGVGRYRQPEPLPGSDELLVSWADGDVNGRNELAGTAPNFGIYLWDPETRERTLVYDDPETWDLYAIPVSQRPIPPALGDTVGNDYDPDEPAVIGSLDLAITSLDENVRGARLDGVDLGTALQSATRVRVIEGFSSEIGPVREFGLTMHEGAAIVGEAQVYEDGSWEASVPPYLPYHLQPLDEYGLAIRNQMLWIQAMPGEERRCGGCHASRSENVLPRMGATSLAQQAGPEDFNHPIPDRMELPWMGATSATNVQDVFNAKCVSCHSGGAGDPFAGRTYAVEVTTEEGEMLNYEIPYLDLSDRPLEVYYEMELVQYPASYVTLLYPSAMMDVTNVTGDMAPEWVVPGSARTSRLVEVVNSPSERNDTWAWDAASHPEDVGVDLTREERLMLIRMADLGGQYWSRRNVEGADSWGSVEY